MRPTVVGQQGSQLGEASRVVAGAGLGQQLAVGVKDRDVVVVRGPVDPAEHVHHLISAPSVGARRPGDLGGFRP